MGQLQGARCLRVVIGLAVVFSATPAAAQPRGGDGDTLGARLQGAKIKRRGSLKSLRAHRITVAGQVRSVGDLADKLFAEQDAITRDLGGARGALLAAPAEDSEIIETDDFTVMVKSTAAVVVDPDKLGGGRLAGLRGRRSTAPPTTADLDPAARREFDAWKAEVLKKPANHPLRIAAQQGDDALLRAVAEGKGELVVTTEVILPRAPVTIENGALVVPARSAGGGFDHTRRGKRKLGFATGDSKRGSQADRDGKPETTSAGQATLRAKFLTGVTKGDSFEWARTWAFPSGYFRVHASAYYGIGLRAPVKVTAVMSPRKIDTSGSRDRGGKMEVEMTAETLDANAAFYRDAGLAEAKVFDGKELVFEAGFDVGYSLKAGFGVIKKSGSVGKDFDFGQDFVPPLANCGTGCGVDVWIPADITRTSIGITLGKKTYIRGSARVGFNLGGGGAVGVSYESIFANDNPASLYRGKARKSHAIVFENRTSHRVKTELPALERHGSRDFGFRLSDPSYTWKLKVTPGVRVDIEVRAGKWIDRTYTVGPLWLNGLALDLGKLELPHHDGTVKSYRLKAGTKTFAP